MSIGDTLAEARSQAGLTITQVSQRTCIRETIIRGIERGDFSACGGDFYARGHIRSIARAVGADEDELIREYDSEHGAPHAIRAADVFEPATPIRIRERRRPNWAVAMILVLVVVAGYGVYRLVSGPSSNGSPSAQNAANTRPKVPSTVAPSSSSSSSSPSPSATPSTAPPVAVPPNDTVVIRLAAIEDCWVEFTRHDGTFLSQAYVLAGSSRSWTFHRAVVMQIGNPGGIVLTVNGKKLGSPGGTGQPVTLSLGPGRHVTG